MVMSLSYVLPYPSNEYIRLFSQEVSSWEHTSKLAFLKDSVGAQNITILPASLPSCNRAEDQHVFETQNMRAQRYKVRGGVTIDYSYYK
jgi:hypothetical protein